MSKIIYKNSLFLPRLLVFIFLFILCIFGGYISYYISSTNEEMILTSQYQSSVKHLKLTILNDMNNKILILRTFVSILTINCYEKSYWPYCIIPMENFLNYADPMIEKSKSRTIQYAPLVRPDEVESFEEFAYDFFETSGYEDMGVSSIGRGIHAVNDTTGKRYHSTEPPPNANHNALFPIFQTGALDHNWDAVMFNVYTHRTSVVPIDAMLNCSYAAIEDGIGDALDIGSMCASITDIVKLTQDDEFDPAVVLRFPIIVPVNASDPSSPLDVVGLVAMVHNWNTVLSRSTCDSELRVVVSNENGEWSFSLECQTSQYISEGNKHNSAYSSMRRRFSLPPFKGDVSYKVSIFPTSSLVDEFRSDGPVYVCAITVAVILLTSIVFMSYDHFVRGEVQKKEEAKTSFVRFISHEMRTPMNVVSLGLKLLYDQLCHLSSMYPTPVCTFENEDGVSQCPELVIPVNVIQEWKDMVSTVEDGSDAAVDVLTSLINYDSIAAGVVLVRTTQLNLWQLVEHCVQQYEIEAVERDVSLRLDMYVSSTNVSTSMRKYMDNLVCMGDESKLVTALRCFLTNALKYTPPGGAILVTVEWKKDGLPYVSFVEKNMLRAGSMVIRVIDNGVGMSAETQQHLFRGDDNFHRRDGHVAHDIQASLRISKSIVEMHGGLISGKSDGVDRGSVFTLELPVYIHKKMRDLSVLDQDSDIEYGVPSGSISPHLTSSESSTTCDSHLTISLPPDSITGETDTAEIPPIPPSSSRLSTYEVCKAVENFDRLQLPRQRVLVVDDVTVCRKVLTNALTRSGYECYDACDGVECLAQYKRLNALNKPVDLIVIDYDMPHMNGPSATKALRYSGCRVPIIGIIGNLASKGKDDFLSHGASAAVFKPLALNHIKAVLSDANDKTMMAEYDKS